MALLDAVVACAEAMEDIVGWMLILNRYFIQLIIVYKREIVFLSICDHNTDRILSAVVAIEGPGYPAPICEDGTSKEPLARSGITK